MKRSWSVMHIHTPHQDEENVHNGDQSSKETTVRAGNGSTDPAAVTTDTPAVLQLRSELSIMMSSVLLSSNENSG